MFDPKILIRNTGIILLFLVIIGYAFWRGNTAIFGINIKSNLVDGQVFTENIVTVSGLAARATRFAVNGNPVLLDEQGNFTLPLLVLPGYSIIDLEAEDRFGRTKHLSYHIVGAFEGRTLPEKAPEEVPEPVDTTVSPSELPSTL